MDCFVLSISAANPRLQYSGTIVSTNESEQDAVRGVAFNALVKIITEVEPEPSDKKAHHEDGLSGTLNLAIRFRSLAGDRRQFNLR